MTKNLPKLFSRDSVGKILSWEIKIRDTLEGVLVLTEYGEYYGKKATSSYHILEGKNIGKSNETTPFEQAIAEATSTWKKHKKKGYKSIEDLKITNIPYDENYDTALYHTLDLKLPKYRTDKNDSLKPMLCQQYYRSKKDWIDPTGEIWDDRKYYYLMNPYVPKESNSLIINFPCIGQPKINGVRCLATISRTSITLKSREGDSYNIPHIIKELESLSNIIINLFKKDTITLDGELYIHGEKLQVINSCVASPNLNTQRLTYEIFDIAIENNVNSKRILGLNLLKNEIDTNSIFNYRHIHIIPSIIVNNDNEAQHETDVFISMGYEGGIFRDKNGYYEFGKRPRCITKLKRCETESFYIVDIIPQTKDPYKGLFVCKTTDGLEFEINPKGDDEYKMLILSMKDMYINKMLQCTFYEYTKDNKLFHIIYNKVLDE